MVRRDSFPRGSAGSARRRSSPQGVIEDCMQLPFPKPKKTERRDCSWRLQQQQWHAAAGRQLWREQQQEQKEQTCQQGCQGHGNRQPRVVRADNSWLSQRRNQSQDLVSYGCLRAEAFREQLVQCGKKISAGKRRHHWMITSNTQPRGMAVSEGIELQPFRRESDSERHKKHQRPGVGVVGRSGLQPKKKEDQKCQASQPLVNEHAQQAEQMRPSHQSAAQPEGAMSQMNADQQGSRVPAIGVQIQEAEPKLFDMTLNDYDDYETDFFPAASTMATDDSGRLLSHHDEDEAKP